MKWPSRKTLCKKIISKRASKNGHTKMGAFTKKNGGKIRSKITTSPRPKNANKRKLPQ